MFILFVYTKCFWDPGPVGQLCVCSGRKLCFSYVFSHKPLQNVWKMMQGPVVPKLFFACDHRRRMRVTVSVCCRAGSKSCVFSCVPIDQTHACVIITRLLSSSTISPHPFGVSSLSLVCRALVVTHGWFIETETICLFPLWLKSEEIPLIVSYVFHLLFLVIKFSWKHLLPRTICSV